MSGDWGTGCFLSCLVPAALHPQPRLAQGSDRFATTPHFVFPKTNSFHTRTDGQGPTSASSHPPLPHHHLRGLASPLESSLQVGVGAACPFLSSCPREGMGMITTGLFGISTSQHSLPHTGRRDGKEEGWSTRTLGEAGGLEGPVGRATASPSGRGFPVLPK